jgi:hypothetical protein
LVFALTAASDHCALSANRAAVLNAQSWRLIIVWLEVRVLPAPPRSLAQTEISRLVANSPELAGIRVRILSLQAVDWISRAVLAPLSLPRKIAFPDSGEALAGLASSRRSGIRKSVRMKTRPKKRKLCKVAMARCASILSIALSLGQMYTPKQSNHAT